jgi:hypothetical protein
MTKQEAIQKVLDCKPAKNSKAYEYAMQAIENPNTPIKVGFNTGSGNYATSKSYQADVARLLSRAGIPYSKGNDAPRKGKNGDNIAVHI